MKHKKLFALAIALLVMLAAALPAFATADAPEPDAVTTEAAESADADAIGTLGRAIACGIAIGLAAGGGAIGMGILSGKATEGVARQPEADGKIRSTLMLSLVFIETAIIYALLVVILIIFVL